MIGFVLLGALTLGAPFRDGAVLQRGMPVRVWGTAAAGEEVTVSFGGGKVSAKADASGSWKLQLPPMKESIESRILTARTSGGEIVEAKDVLVGEVWIASGQSNMEVPLCSTNPRGSERNGALYAQWTRRPFVRLAKIKHRGCAEPTTDGEVVWRKMEPGNGSSEFSAVAWCFAREVADATGIPVGIIGASVGATSIDSWIPKSHFSFKPSKRKGNDPCIYWNGMVAFLAPYSMRGIIWYQGERNSWPDEWPYYCSKMHAFHDGWKAAFGNPHLKLRFVQLAPWGSPTVPQTQCVQQQFADEEPDAAMCVINDLGNLADIHPWNKETVGRRLAALALRYDYGFTDVKADSPRVTAATATTNGMVSLTVANADKLHIYQPEWEFKQNPAATVKLGFELAGTNGVWKSARIENLRRFHAKWMKPNYSEYRGDFAGKEIVLFSPEVPEPKSVRYLFSRPWRGTVYNEARLPLGAFHVEVR